MWKKKKKVDKIKTKQKSQRKTKHQSSNPFFCFGLQPYLLHLSNCTGPVDTSWPHSCPSQQKGEGLSEPQRLKWASGVQEINHTRQIFSYISFFGGGWIQNYRINGQRTGRNTQISKRKAMMALWAWTKVALKNLAYKGQENRKIERKLL